MPKLILFVVCLVIFAVFAAVNTQTVHINYVFGSGDVALIVALVISFTLGVLFTLPIALFGRSKAAKRAEKKEEKTAKHAQTQASAGGPDAAESNAEKISLK